MTTQKLSPLRFESWPALDRDMWVVATQPSDPFKKPGYAARWKPGTRRLTQDGFGLYLSWLEGRGQLDADTRPIDRVDIGRISAFVDDYSHGHAPATVALAVRGIAYMIRACHPPHGLPWLTKAAHSMVNRAEPVKSKTARMATIEELLQLGFTLMETGRRDLHSGCRRGAQVFRDGLMIGALAMRPVRRRNFAALKIGATLLVEAGGIHAAFRETKMGNPIEFAYPEFLLAGFRFYLDTARPLLLAAGADPGSAMLWIGRRGRPMDGEEIAQRISNVTTRHLGRRVSPHLFRDCVATDIASHDPAHVGIVKAILGHTTLATSEKYYNQAGSFHAAKRMRYVIARMREGGGSSPASRGHE